MRGDLLSVWPYVWSDVWVRLCESKGAPVELFSELYATLMRKPRTPNAPPEPTEFDGEGKATDPAYLEAVAQYEHDLETFRQQKIAYSQALTANPDDARQWFREGLNGELKTELDAVTALEAAFQCVDDIGGDDLSNRYFNIVESFLKKYSLRYDLRRPFSLHPNLPGIFASLVREMRELCQSDPDLENSLLEYDEALRDLRLGATPGRLKSCFIKQFNTLEAIASRDPVVTAKVMSAMCGQLQSWPHATVRQAAEKIYAFRGAFPNMGHGTGSGALREIEMRDLVSVSVMMMGLLPYLTKEIDPAVVFGGKA
jgi:tetratricopeptide (TPR) repeat protein